MNPFSTSKNAKEDHWTHACDFEVNQPLDHVRRMDMGSKFGRALKAGVNPNEDNVYRPWSLTPYYWARLLGQTKTRIPKWLLLPCVGSFRFMVFATGHVFMIACF